MYLQSISVKHNAANSVNRSILKKSRHIGFGVFIVHSSMVVVVGFDRLQISHAEIKGVGPGPTLAWPGWKQPDIPVEVDTDRLETGRSEAAVLKKLSLAGIAKLSRLKYMMTKVCLASANYHGLRAHNRLV